MEMFLHRFTALFEQLGLPNDPESIRAFIHTHAPLADSVRLEDAPFWTSSQTQPGPAAAEVKKRHSLRHCRTPPRSREAPYRRKLGFWLAPGTIHCPILAFQIEARPEVTGNRQISHHCGDF